MFTPLPVPTQRSTEQFWAFAPTPVKTENRNLLSAANPKSPALGLPDFTDSGWRIHSQKRLEMSDSSC
jgi:hypothetical protein